MEKDIHTVSCETCQQPALFGISDDGEVYAVCTTCRLATPVDDMLLVLARAILRRVNTDRRD